MNEFTFEKNINTIACLMYLYCKKYCSAIAEWLQYVKILLYTPIDETKLIETIKLLIVLSSLPYQITKATLKLKNLSWKA